MAGPRPDDTYNPVQSVAPTTQAPNDYLQVRADPSAFGGQIGEATSKLGSTISQGGQEEAGIALQQMGLANEHAANQADLQLATEGGKITDEYKSLSGLAASTAKDSFVNKQTALYEQIASSLPNPAARRAFEQTAIRRMSFNIQDMNSYAAQQQKAAYTKGFDDQIQLAQDQVSRIDVASDPTQMKWETDSLTFALNSKLTAPGVGPYSNISAKTGSDGKLQFDTSTKEGKLAQADYDNQLQQESGKAFDTAVKTIAFDLTGKGGFDKAFDFMQSHKDDMPASTFAKLTQELHGPYLNEIARQGTEDILSGAHAAFNTESGEAATSYPNNPGNVKNKENTAFVNPASPTDGVVLTTNNLRSPGYQNLTLAQIAKRWTGESPDKVSAWLKNVSTSSGLDPNTIPDLNNPTVLKSLVRGITVAEKSKGDQAAFTDDVINQGVQGSLSGKQAALSDNSSPVISTGYRTLPSYLGDHASDLIQQARDAAKDRDLDTAGQDLFAERMKTRISEVMTAQREEVHYLKENVLGKVMDDKNPMTNMSMLDNSGDPALRQQWIKLQSEDPYAAMTVRNIVTANAQGKSKTYGTDFATHLDEVLGGKITDSSALGPYVGGDKSPVSASGYRALSAQIEDMKTPEGQAFAQAEKKFFDDAKGLITGTAIYPGLDGSSRQSIYEKFLMDKLPQINAAKAAGKNSSQIFGDQKSSDYVGKDLGHYTPKDTDLAAMMNKGALQDIGRANLSAGATDNKAFDVNTVKTKDDLFKNVHNMTRQQFDSLAHKLNLVGPQVPQPFQ